MRRLYLLLLLLLALGCQKLPVFENGTDMIVVEGWIEDNGYPVVILTRSLPIDTTYRDMSDLSDYIVRWAKVTVSDGTESVILTGMTDNNYFPPYIYTTSHIKGKAGRKYYLTVEDGDQVLTAETTIPSPPDSCGFRVERCAQSDTLYQITACFTDNPAEHNYYQFFTRVENKDRQHLASFLGSIDDSSLDGYTEIPVYRGRSIFTENVHISYDEHYPYFAKDEIVSVRFAQVDYTSFRIWDSYLKMLSVSGNLFLSTSTDIQSNIVGGLGYWCGYGAINQTLVIK